MFLRSSVLMLCAASLGAGVPEGAMAQECALCHAPAAGEVYGVLDTVITRSRTFQVRVDEDVEVFHYDKAALKVQAAGAPAEAEAALKGLGKGREVRIEVSERDGARFASLVSAKPPAALAPDDRASAELLDRLTVPGAPPAAGLLLDVRSRARFREGSLPNARSLPFEAFNPIRLGLPADRTTPLVLFSEGPTCPLAPAALAHLRRMGYVHARVDSDGWSGWRKRHPGVLSVASLKAAYLDRHRPVVLIDARPAGPRPGGVPKGAVQFPAMGVKGLVEQGLPSIRAGAPLIVVDEKGGTTAQEVAQALLEDGQTNVSVLTGGFRGWRAARLPVARKAADKVAWHPEPRPGTVSPATFERLASLAPEARGKVLILDVRSRSEAQEGMIKGALNAPLEELESHLPEIPKDRRILVHCHTGARAEMGYRILKAHGYDAAYLGGEITILDTGEFTLN